MARLAPILSLILLLSSLLAARPPALAPGARPIPWFPADQPPMWRQVSQKPPPEVGQAKLPSAASPARLAGQAPTPGALFSAGRLGIVYLEGNRLQFLSAAGVAQLAELDPEQASLGCPAPLALSPQADRLAFNRSGELWLVKRDGSGLQRAAGVKELQSLSPVVSDGQISPARLAWTPDGSSLLLMTQADSVPFPARFDNLLALDLASGKLRRLLPAGQGGEIYPAPVGGLAAVSGERAIRLVDLKSGNAITAVTFPAIQTHTEFGFRPAAAWSPDGRYFLAAVPPADPVMRPQEPTTIWRVEAPGGRASRLGKISAGFGARTVYFSPDRQKLAYVFTLEPTAVEMELHVANVDGSGDQVILRGNPDLAGWTAEGWQVVYYDMDRRQQRRITPGGLPEDVILSGVLLGGEPLSYGEAGGGLLQGPDLLKGRHQRCAWGLLAPGAVDESAAQPMALPTATPAGYARPTDPPPATLTANAPTSPPPTQTQALSPRPGGPPGATPSATPSPRPTASRASYPAATPAWLPGRQPMERRQVFRAQQGGVNALAFSPDGKLLASSDKNGLVLLTALDGGTPTLKLGGHDGSVTAVAFSPDGKLLASAGADHTIKLWSRRGALLRTLNAHPGPVYALAFSPDGLHLASGGRGGPILLWDLSAGAALPARPAGELPEPRGTTWALAFTQDGELISGGADGALHGWDLDKKGERWSLKTGSTVYSLALPKEGGPAAAGLQRGGVLIFDPQRGRAVASFAAHKGAVNSLAFFPGAARLASGGDDGRIALYDLAGLETLQTWKAHSGWVLGLAWSPDGALLASAGGEGDSSVILWAMK